ncbi:hypothetical protein [Pyxidicoccus xibeiensis]|uniref:hypothetical protein n=1 Tax=Pyxidicoccus xibeiensis TaxID=2906759 RepID=UPI0020A709CA|nr:hypothetical protein [Pyxidicoccus xibeiensis]MCP3138269.1 hypothetical protein [Pyxidicoccus xibeiensis]
MTPEQHLESFYRANRDQAVEYFYGSLCNANIKSYVEAPRGPTLAAVGQSFDNLISGLVNRTPELYVQSQTEMFKKRIAAGVAPRDLLAGLKSAEASIAWLIEQASLERPEFEPQLRRMGQQYLLMAQMTALSVRAYQP